VRDLLHEPGVQRHDEGRFALEPAGLTSAALRDDRDVTYRLTLEARGNRVTVRGTARGEWSGPCRRCLEQTDGDVVAQIDEIFETRHSMGETWPITDGVIDLEPVLREALLLELPLAPLCREDCPGPAPDRYPTSTVDDEAVEDPPRDPRWAALADLNVDDLNVDDLNVDGTEGTDP
jgi:uncharacterized protein